MLGICFCNDTFLNVAILFITLQLILIVSYWERILYLLSWGKSDNAVIKLQILQNTQTFQHLKSFFQDLNVFIALCTTQVWISLIVFITRMESLGIANLDIVTIRQMCSHWFPYTLYSPIVAVDSLFAESFPVVLSNNLYSLSPVFANQNVEEYFQTLHTAVNKSSFYIGVKRKFSKQSHYKCTICFCKEWPVL